MKLAAATILGLATMAGLLCIAIRWGDCAMADW